MSGLNFRTPWANDFPKFNHPKFEDGLIVEFSEDLQDSSRLKNHDYN